MSDVTVLSISVLVLSIYLYRWPIQKRHIFLKKLKILCACRLYICSIDTENAYNFIMWFFFQSTNNNKISVIFTLFNVILTSNSFLLLIYLNCLDWNNRYINRIWYWPSTRQHFHYRLKKKLHYYYAMLWCSLHRTINDGEQQKWIDTEIAYRNSNVGNIYIIT